MKVINDLLNIGDLKIVQDTDFFKFSLDSIMLSSFVIPKKNEKIIDLCAGNAPISMILAKLYGLNVIAVELQKEVYDLAKESIEINNLSDKIKLLNYDAKQITDIYQTDMFDRVICNPPYFKINEGSKINNNKQKTIARHEVMFDLDSLFKISKKILKNNGKVNIVHRTNRLSEILDKMLKNNIQPKRIRFIYPYKDSESNMVLIEGTKNGKTGIKVMKPLIIYNDKKNYTNEIIKIFDGGNNEN